jgi:ABC-type branched-subunit amino acid transport system permease subunit
MVGFGMTEDRDRAPTASVGVLSVGFQEYFRELEAWRLVMYGALLIAVMLFAPKGLAGLKRYVW